MTRNPFISGQLTFNSTLNLTNSLLSSSSGISPEIFQNLFESVSNTLYFTSIQNTTNEISRYSEFCNQLVSSLNQNLLIGQNLSLVYGKVSIDVQKIILPESNYLMQSSNQTLVKTLIPVELFDEAKSNGEKFLTLALGYLQLDTQADGSIVEMTVFDGKGKIEARVNESFFEIFVPHFNFSDVKTPVCVFLNESRVWSQKGCVVKEIELLGINCMCSHLTSFSAGDLDGGFFPSSNIDQTVNFESLNSITAVSAIGFYFVSFFLIGYIVLGLKTMNLDKTDLINSQELLEDKNTKIFKNPPRFVGELNEGEIIDVAMNLDINDYSEDSNIKENVSQANKMKELFDQTIKEHKFFSIFKFYDPLRSRFNRISLVFLNLIVKMYFIGLFYKSEKVKSASFKGLIESYTLRDVLVIFWTNLIMIAMNSILMYCMKMKIVEPNMPREVFIAHKKYNYKKNIAIFVTFLAIFAYFLWSIAMFAMNLEQFVSYKWIINSSVSILIAMFLTPLIKALIVTFVINLIIEKIKRMRERNKINTIIPSMEDIDIYAVNNQYKNDVS